MIIYSTIHLEGSLFEKFQIKKHLSHANMWLVGIVSISILKFVFITHLQLEQ